MASLAEIVGSDNNSGRQSVDAASLSMARGRIRFEHVTFRYHEGLSDVLKDLSFEIPVGQIVGIVGRSGSGKTTVAKLVQGLYKPRAGRILIDDIDIDGINTEALRRVVSSVFQEPIPFNMSVHDNIALPNPDASYDDVIECAKLAAAHSFIMQLPNGYDTVVGIAGGSLSVGQRQRIAIARSLICKSRILVLDEATAALDYEAEEYLMANFRSIAQDRTVLVVAHRPSSLRYVDRVLTFDEGRIIEDGPPRELELRQGFYSALTRRVAAGDYSPLV